MGFGLRIFPGVRISASSRGIRAGVGPRAATGVRALEAAGSGSGMSRASYRVCDPQNPGRELLVQFVSADLAQLAASAAESRSDDKSPTMRNAFGGLLSSLPASPRTTHGRMCMGRGTRDGTCPELSDALDKLLVR